MCTSAYKAENAMSASTTITLRVPAELKSRLVQLAAHTKRTPSFLAGEAIAAYVKRELAIVEGIAEGLADVEAGRLVPHDEAMAELDAAIEAAAKEGTKRRRA
jgi:predicted transcriptional regulator